MENYTRETLRELYENTKNKNKGSFLVTLIIIAIFVASCVFYLKTSKPDMYNKAVACITSTVEKIEDSVKKEKTESDVPFAEAVEYEKI